MKLHINDLLFKNLQKFVHKHNFENLSLIDSEGSQSKILKYKNVIFGQYLNEFFGKCIFTNSVPLITSLTLTNNNYLNIFLKSESIRKSLEQKTLKVINYNNKQYFINYLKKDFEILEDNLVFGTDFNYFTMTYRLPNKTIFIHSEADYAITKTHLSSKNKQFNLDYLAQSTRSIFR